MSHLLPSLSTHQSPCPPSGSVQLYSTHYTHFWQRSALHDFHSITQYENSWSGFSAADYVPSQLLWVTLSTKLWITCSQTVPVFNICAMMESGHGFILLYVKWNFLGVQDILSVVFSVTFKMFCFTVTNKKKVCAVKCTHRFSVLIWDLAWRVQCGLILRKQQEEACHRLVHFHTLTLIGRACIASRLQRRFCVLFLDVSSELFEICCYHWTAVGVNWLGLLQSLKQIRKVLFSGTNCCFKEASKCSFHPWESSWKVLLRGLEMFTLASPKANKVSHAHTQTHTWYWNVNMLSSPVFRFLSACLPPQRLVPIFPCRRRLIRRTGACFCLGLEHGLDGGNGGPVLRTLSWQKHQTLQQLGTLLQWWLNYHSWSLRAADTPPKTKGQTLIHSRSQKCW